MKISEAKQLVKNGTHQIHNDCDKVELLNEVLDNHSITGIHKYYSNTMCRNSTFNKKTIKLSEIEEDVIKYQFFYCNEWIDITRPVRIKPEPDFSKEIEALQKKAKEAGMKIEINFVNL